MISRCFRFQHPEAFGGAEPAFPYAGETVGTLWGPDGCVSTTEYVPVEEMGDPVAIADDRRGL